MTISEKIKSKLIEAIAGDEKLCDFCDATEFGKTVINTGPWNICEGRFCDSATENYIHSIEEKFDDPEICPDCNEVVEYGDMIWLNGKCTCSDCYNIRSKELRND